MFAATEVDSEEKERKAVTLKGFPKTTKSIFLIAGVDCAEYTFTYSLKTKRTITQQGRQTESHTGNVQWARCRPRKCTLLARSFTFSAGRTARDLHCLMAAATIKKLKWRNVM